MVAEEAIRPGTTRSPFELGLSWLVDPINQFLMTRLHSLKKRKELEIYICKTEYQKQQTAHGSYLYNQANKKIGTVTSAMFSPSAKANIAYASLHDPWNKDKDKIITEIYYQKDLEWNGVMEKRLW